MSKFDSFMKDLESASVLELNDLVKAIEEKFGVSAAAVAAAGPAAGGAEAVEEKDAFTVVLSSAGEQKIAVMKVVKEALGLGLKDAKDLVDAAPSDVRVEVNKEKADAVVKKFIDAGALAEAIPLPVSLR